MHNEIEAKLKVDSHEAVIEKLEETGAEFIAEQLQKDCYFDDAASQLIRGDRGLRLRRQLTGDSEKIFLTYKGAREKHRFKSRQEIELEVGDGDLAEKFLSALGYRKALTVEKKRQVWRAGECVVALDHVELLGNFVEIEGPDDRKIADVQKSLGLSHLPHIKESYAFMVREKLDQAGKENV